MVNSAFCNVGRNYITLSLCKKLSLGMPFLERPARHISRMGVFQASGVTSQKPWGVGNDHWPYVVEYYTLKSIVLIQA